MTHEPLCAQAACQRVEELQQALPAGSGVRALCQESELVHHLEVCVCALVCVYVCVCERVCVCARVCV